MNPSARATINQNILAQLIPLNALLPEDLRTLAQHVRLESLPAGKKVNLNGISQKIYILKGKAQLLAEGKVLGTIEGGTSAARYAINRRGEGLSLQTETTIHFIRVDMHLVESGSPQQVQVIHENRPKPKVKPLPTAAVAPPAAKKTLKKLWMDRLVDSPIFRQLSPGNIRRVMERLEEIPHNKGDFIIRAGEKPTSFFVVKKGQCTVAYKAKGTVQKLAILNEGDGFGAISLLSERPHEINVVMNTAGEIERLDKDDFYTWIFNPIIKTISYRHCQELYQKGGIWLDVRNPEEHHQAHIPQSVHIPLLLLHAAFPVLRQKFKTLTEKGPYLVYSNEEQRASAAVYRLLEQGIESFVLSGGLQEVPERFKTHTLSEEDQKRQQAEASKRAKQQQLAKDRAEAEKRARIEAEKRASAEAAALLAQVMADAQRLAEEKRRQEEERERLRQEKQAQLEEAKRQIEEEKRRQRQHKTDQFRVQLQAQMETLKAASEMEKEERRRLEEKIAQELNRLNQEKVEQQSHLELERRQAEEQAKLLQVQLHAARAVEEERREREYLMAGEPRHGAAKSMVLKTSLIIATLGGIIGAAIFALMQPTLFGKLIGSPLEPPSAQTAALPKNGEAGAAKPAEEKPAEEELTQITALRYYSEPVGKGVFGPAMISLPGGTFLMGSPPHYPTPESHPQHKVTLSPFSISQYEITFEEYDYFAKQTGRPLPDDRRWGRGKQPVVNVSWNDAKAYASWLSEKTGKDYHLPSEREWEYTVMMGAQTRYWWGDDMVMNQANCGNCGSTWDGKQPAPVGSFQPNPLRLYDGHGNVAEWVAECFHPNYQGSPSHGQIWSGGQCQFRMIRGGSFRNYTNELYGTFRKKKMNVEARSDEVGFRVARAD